MDGQEIVAQVCGFFKNGGWQVLASKSNIRCVYAETSFQRLIGEESFRYRTAWHIIRHLPNLDM